MGLRLSDPCELPEAYCEMENTNRRRTIHLPFIRNAYKGSLPLDHETFFFFHKSLFGRHSIYSAYTGDEDHWIFESPVRPRVVLSYERCMYIFQRAMQI